MSTFSVSGLSSGVDFASMTTKLMDLERRPVNLLKAKQNDYQDQLKTWSDVKGKISELETIANSMKTLSDLSPITSSFSNNNSQDTRSVVSILSTGVTSEQNFDITVNRLAKSHRIMSAGVEDSGTLQPGTFSVAMGGTTTDFTISLDGTNNTLEKLKTSINAANLGLTASIIDDGSSATPNHLILTSDEVGAANAITVQHSATPFSVLGTDVYPNAVLSFSELQAAQDAQIVFGGQTIARPSNTFSDLIDKTTIQINNAGSGTISFAKNDTSLKEKIVNFVSKFNETKQLIQKNTSYDYAAFDPANKPNLPLFGDSTLLGVLSTMNNLAANEVTGLTGTYTSLASIGITTSKQDGSLTIDNAKLDESIANDHAGVANIFVASGTESNTSVTFVGQIRDTSSGTYTTHFTGTDSSGNVQGYFKDSAGNQYTATGNGRFLQGSTGIAKGLTVRIAEAAAPITTTTNNDPVFGDNSITGYSSIGSVSLSLGVAEKISREIYNLNVFDGRFSDKTKNIEDAITENAKKIKFQEDILVRREDEYKRRFANLEGVLGAMQGQSQFMSSQLNSMNYNRRYY
ncbi:MAG: flagellar filament capping protein FliD [Nitrospinae bacterium]|nr:flagellar filament capping protein FliD [Nitrospinota bacterium]